MPRLNFTKSVLLGLPLPTTGRETYTDEKTPGLELRITPAGVRTFYVRRRVRGTGKLERITVGRFPEVTVEAARRAALGHVAALAEGRSVTAEHRAKRARGVTLGDVLADYLGAHDLKPSTATEYAETVERHLADWLPRPVVEITRDDVERLHRKLSKATTAVRKDAMGRKRKVSVGGPAAANRVGRILRALLNYAAAKYEDEAGRPIILDNPVRRLSALKAWNRVDRRRRRIERDELAAWLAAVDAERERAPVAADFLELCLFTGLRRNEAASLRVADVNLRGKRFTVTDTKNRDPHTLPVGPHVLALLQRRIAAARASGSEYLFASTGAAGYLNTPAKPIARITEACGVAFSTHDLRRTFASIAESLDVPGYALKRLLNHRNEGDVTAGYVVIDVERLRAPMELIESFILRTAGRAPTGKVVEIEAGRARRG
ncbi:integrase family protein [Fulvimonas yonginensis]|uniref:Integrase family protein n=1 Tax=Fulvimonas yonginensis TaxID=1495200 RepID=A0ABU8J997_9GAMM